MDIFVYVVFSVYYDDSEERSVVLNGIFESEPDARTFIKDDLRGFGYIVPMVLNKKYNNLEKEL